MSFNIDLIINKKINYNSLIKTIKGLGCKKRRKGFYYFYEEKDFLSLSMIEVIIYWSEDFTEILTRTAGLRYSFDIEKQKEIIKTIQKKFGGHMQNDWSLNSWKDIKYSTLERGCGLANLKFQSSKMKVYGMIDQLDDKHTKEYIPIFSDMNPSCNITNLIVPFLVSSFEDFLKTFFIRYIDYGKKININNDRKIEKKFKYEDLIKISKGELTIGEIISERFNFQNLKHINTAYEDFFDFRYTDLINKKKKFQSGKFYNLKAELNKIIQMRHLIIHEAEYVHISKEEIKDIADIIFKCGDELISYIEKRDNINLNFN